MKKLIILNLLAALILIRQVVVLADKPDMVTWCHCEPNGNCETLHLPEQALEQAGHVDAKGNPLHAGDHAGECVEPTQAVTPTIIPTGQITPTQGTTPTISVPTPSPVIPSPSITSVQPTGVQPTSIPPTGTPSNSSSPSPVNPDQVSAMGPGNPSLGGWK